MGFNMFSERVQGLRRTKSRRERIPDCWSCNMKRAWTKMKISARDVQVSGGWWVISWPIISA